jgi:hypothetical protein
MDAVKILKRAWQILWSYRALWVFGVILALTAGGGFGRGGGGGGRGWEERRGPESFEGPPAERFSEGIESMQEWIDQGLPPLNISPEDLNALMWVGIAFVVMLVILAVVMAIARYVAETALIRMVDDYEGSGTKVSIRQGFRYGWSRTSWRLFLINFLVNLPVLLFLVVLLLVGIGIYLLVTQGNQVLTVTGIVAGIGLVFISIFLVIIVSVILNLLRHFFWRACALEGLGVRASLRRGFEIVRQNWKNVGLMWLIMIGLGIGWAIASILIFIVMIPAMVVTALAGIIAGGLPGLLFVGITSLFLGQPLPWLVGAIIGLPLFLLVTFSPVIFIQGLAMTFSSTVWTLTYRELNALQSLAPEA